jgi:hypothetical protein
MPQFKFPNDARPFIEEINSIDYSDGNHVQLFDNIKNVINLINQPTNLAQVRKQDAPPKYMTPLKQMTVLFGAVLFTMKTIKDEYAGTNTAGWGASKSRFYKLLKNTSLIYQLSSCDDKSQVMDFAYRTFYQWYELKAFEVNAQGEKKRLLENPYLGDTFNQEECTSFEKRLSKIAANLPEVTDKMFKTIVQQDGVIANLIPQQTIQKNTGGQGWGSWVSSFWRKEPTADTTQPTPLINTDAGPSGAKFSIDSPPEENQAPKTETVNSEEDDNYLLSTF